ncbi:MAG: hypothetical protein U9O20_00170 [Patescibacteria group bacterium]|nr:hypothetical protein [Patescibacteria group bacterium]
MSYVAVVMLEQDDDKESGMVCLVEDVDLKTVKKVIFGKGYSVQRYDDGVAVF